MSDQSDDSRPLSTALAAAGLAAMRALLRALNEADVAVEGELVGAWVREAPARVYEGLLAAVLRAVVVRIAAARGLRIEATAAGSLLDARAWPLLEGRSHDGRAVAPGLAERVARALSEALDAASLPYDALDVEALGTVHEALMGFTLARASEPSRCVGPRHVVVGLEDLLATAPDTRLARLAELADVHLTGRAAAMLRGANSLVMVSSALARRASPLAPQPIAPGVLYLQPTVARRRSGSHYTPRALTGPVVRDTLAPLIDAAPTPEQVLARRVCDPAMGSGAFLVEACRQLADALATAWRAHGAPALEGGETLEGRALIEVARRCLYGVDRNRMAVALARLSLWITARAQQEPLAFVDDALREGDALVEEALADDVLPSRGVRWREEYSAVFARDGGGFDAIVGNPPWVSYAGRAAQPLDAARRRYYLARYASFAGYRNLQGLFVELAARLARPGGRVGLVLPSSMAELDGYAPTRAAHDALAVCDPLLPDLGEDGFLGVFQPSMVLRSTVRAMPLARGSGAAWPIERPDVDGEAQAILARLDGPCLPPELFGERGLQTSGDDTDRCAVARDASHAVALRVGSDVRAFYRGAPSLYADASWFGARLREGAEWAKVAVLVRQTARVPIAARSDGEGFRNSLLAGFESGLYPAGFLVAYLNSTVVRWRHFYRNRDARLGMPQVKIGHLRAIVAPPARVVDELARIGDALSTRNAGVTNNEMRAIDDIVADAFGLTEADRVRIARDAARW